jgi:hypothetical protein
MWGRASWYRPVLQVLWQPCIQILVASLNGHGALSMFLEIQMTLKSPYPPQRAGVRSCNYSCKESEVLSKHWLFSFDLLLITSGWQVAQCMGMVSAFKVLYCRRERTLWKGVLWLSHRPPGWASSPFPTCSHTDVHGPVPYFRTDFPKRRAVVYSQQGTAGATICSGPPPDVLRYRQRYNCYLLALKEAIWNNAWHGSP